MCFNRGLTIIMTEKKIKTKSKTPVKNIYRVHFSSHRKDYEVYCKSIVESDIFGFIEIEQLIFGETSTVVIDPSEESIKAEFSDVKCSLIPMHAITRIDIVEKEGVAKIVQHSNDSGSNISAFPSSVYQQPKDRDY